MNPSFRCGWGVHQLSCIFSVRKGKKMTSEKFFLPSDGCFVSLLVLLRMGRCQTPEAVDALKLDARQF